MSNNVQFAGPWPAIQTFIHLPTPEFSNSEGITGTVEFKRTINNTKYTYVRSRAQRRKLQVNFRMTVAKGFELFEFIRSYHATQVRYRDELSQDWVGYFITNPNEFETQSLGAKSAEGMYGYVDIQIEFEGTLQ